MAFTETYLNYDLASGANDGTSEANAWQDFATCLAAVSAGDRVNVKRTSSRISDINTSWNVSGTASAPIHIRAYTSTIGDGGMFEWAKRFQIPGENVLLEGFDIEANNTLLLWVNGDMSCAYRCKVVSTATGGAIVTASDAVLINCYIKALSGNSYAVQVYGGSLIGCYVEVPAGAIAANRSAIRFQSSGGRKNNIINCLVKGNGDADLIGIRVTNDHQRNGGVISNNTIENCGIGIQLTQGSGTGKTDLIVIQNNIIYNGVKGMENLQGTNISTIGHIINNNAIGNLSGAAYTAMGDWVLNPITLTSNPFIDTTDYELNDASGGGALCKFLGAIPKQSDPSLAGPTFAYDRVTGRTNFTSIGGVQPKGAESSHVF